MSKYSIGFDFGTQSVRGLLIDISNGKEIKTAVSKYKHSIGKIENKFTNIIGKEALEDPNDYCDAFFACMDKLLSKIPINKSDIVGIGVDSHCSSFFPIDRNLKPMCNLAKYSLNKDAYIKMWKHHSAQKYADEINEFDRLHRNKINEIYGGKTSSEWFFPKLIETFVDSQELYKDTYSFVEIGDYIIYLLTGILVRSEVVLKCKYHYVEKDFLIDDFIVEKYPKMKNYRQKLKGKIKKIGQISGFLNDDIISKYGLAKIPVSVLNTDALVNPVCFGVFDETYVTTVIGTSMCDIINKKEFKLVNGSCGTIFNASLPNYYSYESGQIAVGDLLNSFIKKFEKEFNDSPYDELNRKAAKIKPGGSGLISLDFFNGNRSTLNDSNLSGLLLGMSLETKKEEIYRALIEAIAFGLKKILINYKNNGIDVTKIMACGGIPNKNALFMQILSDVTGLEICVSRSDYSAALSSAIYGAYISGEYKDLFEASSKIGGIRKVYKPNKKNNEVYSKLFNLYNKLYESKEINSIMKSLIDIKSAI